MICDFICRTDEKIIQNCLNTKFPESQNHLMRNIACMLGKNYLFLYCTYMNDNIYSNLSRLSILCISNDVMELNSITGFYAEALGTRLICVKREE